MGELTDRDRFYQIWFVLLRDFAVFILVVLFIYSAVYLFIFVYLLIDYSVLFIDYVDFIY